ncbi:MAG: protein kinase [Myxococcales bacterium]|nr:protein kinase [Myxococcales bacterium]
MVGQPDAGPRIIGRYALFAQIAAGGMAAVHLGRLLGQAGFARTVAIKRLHPYLSEDPEFVSMLIDEARLVARIRHPNVVSTLDVVAVDGEILVVMEYVHGESLAKLLGRLRKQGTAVPAAIASNIISGVLYGLHAAHDAKDESGRALDVIHRDVSPQNVIVGADGVARVVDFGVAKAAGRLQETREGQLKGKIRYMAAEQLKHGEVDRTVDVYAASVVLWECLTGRRLFDDDNEWKIAHAIAEGASTPPSQLVPGVPPELDAIVMKGLSPDRSLRFQTAFEMASAIEDAVPPATARQVAAWVDSVASDALQARAAMVATVEEQSRDLVDATPATSGSWSRPSAASLPDRTSTPDEGSEPSRTGAGTAKSYLPTGRTASGRTWSLPLVAALVAVGVVAVGIGAFSAVKSGRVTAVSAAPSTGAPSPPTTTARAASAATSATAPAPKESAQMADAPAPSGNLPSGPRPVSGKVRPRSQPKAGAATCEPPYFFDSKGVKHFKPECL